MTVGKTEYIGDGVYLTDDGYQLWLAVNDHHRVVALEPAVFENLVERGTARLLAMGQRPSDPAPAEPLSLDDRARALGVEPFETPKTLVEQLLSIAYAAEVSDYFTDDMRLMPADGVADVVYDAAEQLARVATLARKLAALSDEEAEE